MLYFLCRPVSLSNGCLQKVSLIVFTRSRAMFGHMGSCCGRFSLWVSLSRFRFQNSKCQICAKRSLTPAHCYHSWSWICKGWKDLIFPLTGRLGNTVSGSCIHTGVTCLRRLAPCPDVTTEDDQAAHLRASHLNWFIMALQPHVNRALHTKCQSVADIIININIIQ